jgi:ornithine cyclodeaminase/alanine dehydrogenase-like protein (mu-crystallin family)
VLKLPASRNVYGLMPAYSRSLGMIGTKLISVFPDNHGTELDSHQGVVMLFDGTNGSPLALMDAASITAIRTAAVSGVATKLLARQDARSVAILGSGVQGHTHVDAMMAARPFERVVVWSRNTEHARTLAASATKKHGVAVTTAPTAEAAVREADVVCTVTASREPVLQGQWLRPGTHLNVVGASIPTAREIDTDAVKRSRVFVDRRESALAEAGDLLIPIQEGAVTAAHIGPELGELIVGSAQGRASDAEITLFKSLGIAVEDLASAHYLYDSAKQEGSGTWVEL